MTKLTDQQKQQVVKAAESYMAAHSLSNRKFAAEVANVSVSYLSYMLAGKWNEMPHGSDPNKFVAIADKYFERVADAIGYQLEKQYRTHCDSDNFMAAINTYNDARADKLPHCVDGTTGQGKSYAAEIYKRMNPANTFLVTCADDLTSKSFMVELALAVGVKPVGAIYEIRRAVQKKLLSVDRPLLIIDESENLKDRAWGAIKAMMDAMKGYCGIVLNAAPKDGRDSFQEWLEWKSDRVIGCFPQIYRRINEGGFTPLAKLDFHDVKDYAELFGITNVRVVNGLYDRCKNFGQVTYAVEKLLRESEALKTPIDANLLEVLIPTTNRLPKAA